jgi:hypothetical protein
MLQETVTDLCLLLAGLECAQALHGMLSASLNALTVSTDPLIHFSCQLGQLLAIKGLGADFTHCRQVTKRCSPDHDVLRGSSTTISMSTSDLTITRMRLQLVRKQLAFAHDLRQGLDATLQRSVHTARDVRNKRPLLRCVHRVAVMPVHLE